MAWLQQQSTCKRPNTFMQLFGHQHEDPCKSRAGHTFFELISFNIKLSSMLSIVPLAVCLQTARGASSFFNLAFSSSSCFSLRASLTSMPPSRAFHLKNVALPIACLRHRSATVMPLSCSRNIPIICSSLNLLCFIVFSLKTESDSTHSWISLKGSGQLQGPSITDKAKRCCCVGELQLEWQAWSISFWGDFSETFRQPHTLPQLIITLEVLVPDFAGVIICLSISGL